MTIPEDRTQRNRSPLGRELLLAAVRCDAGEKLDSR